MSHPQAAPAQPQCTLPPAHRFDVVLIGGSAGSFPVISRMLEKLRPGFPLPLVMCLHRLKDKREGFKEALMIKSNLPVEEPNDKGHILPGKVYVAPANYHLLVENKAQFALSTTEVIQYSRPSIDVLFEAAADVYKNRALAILFSGANRDGAVGMKRLKDKGAFLVVQDPADCAMPTMPEAAIKATPVDQLWTAAQIANALEAYNSPLTIG